MNTQNLKKLVHSGMSDSAITFYLKMSLTGDPKFCFTNKYIKENFNISVSTTNRLLEELQLNQFITREIHYAADGKTVLGRTITLK